MKPFALSVMALMTLASTALAGFGIGVGATLEERVGGDYGPEYYRSLHEPKFRHDGHGATRCRSRFTETRFGLRRVRRCHSPG